MEKMLLSTLQKILLKRNWVYNIFNMQSLQINGQIKYTVKDSLEEVQKELQVDDRVDIDMPIKDGVQCSTFYNLGDATEFIMGYFNS